MTVRELGFLTENKHGEAACLALSHTQQVCVGEEVLLCQVL